MYHTGPISYTSGQALVYAILRGDGLFYDFGDGTFKSTPTTLRASLPEITSSIYQAILTSTPQATFPDGTYYSIVWKFDDLVNSLASFQNTMTGGDDSGGVDATGVSGLPLLCQAVNGFFRKRLSTAHVAGSGTLAFPFNTLSGFPALSAQKPIRLTAYTSDGTTETVLGIFQATGISGDTLTGVTGVEGYADVNIDTNAYFDLRMTAGFMNNLREGLYIVNQGVQSLLSLGLANSVVTTGSYANPTWIASLAGSKITGNIAGNAASITGSIAESQVTGLVGDLSSLQSQINSLGGGVGTVTSVGLTAPTQFSVGAAVTSSGNLALSWVAQAPNLVLAGPTTGANAAPTFRSLVTADFPASGVSAGTYTNSTITVDATGRVTSASNGSAGGSAVVISPASDTANVIQSTGDFYTLRHRAAAGQTKAVSTFENSAGTILSQVSAAGFWGYNVSTVSYAFHARSATTDTYVMYLDAPNGIGGFPAFAVNPSDGNRRVRITSINAPLQINTHSDIYLDNQYNENTISIKRPASASSGTVKVYEHVVTPAADLTGTAALVGWTYNLKPGSASATGDRKMVSWQLNSVEKCGIDSSGRFFLTVVTSDPIDTPTTASVCYNTTNKKLWIFTPGTGWSYTTLT